MIIYAVRCKGKERKSDNWKKRKRERKERFNQNENAAYVCHHFGVVLLAWLLTFLVPAGKFSTQEIEYTDANGDISTRTVLMQDSFRYAYR